LGRASLEEAFIQAGVEPIGASHEETKAKNKR
jgi:hypothetical protein